MAILFYLICLNEQRINDSFEHNAINYSVIDFVPFKDFGMEPVSWSK